MRQGAITSFKAEKRYIRKNGSVVWAGLTVALKRDRDGRKLYDVSIVEDISARKEAEECIHYLANHDPLTGLPNRARFSHLLNVACETARRERRRFAVLFVDLDRFKIINDSLGHEAGDAMLRAAAARLRGCVRASDVVARLGGDEFVVLLQDVSEPSVAAKVASNVLKSLAEPVAIQGHDCTVSASIGICLHPDGEQEDQAVLRNADMAMYLAKQSGKNGYRLYVNELNALSAERAAIELRLRGALERDEYVVVFDARVDAATSEVVALEARIRWTNPELAAIATEKLSAAAEAAGLLVPVNQRALRAACAARAGWRGVGATVPVAVSIATGQVTDHAFVGEVAEILRSAGLEPRMLELNVTEDVLLYDSARAARTLTALKSLGVAIAIDAFGTGKASFADLQRFPVDTLKLHHSTRRRDRVRPRQTALRRRRHRARPGARLTSRGDGRREPVRRRVPARQRLHGAAGSDRAAGVVGERVRGAAARAPLDWPGGDRQDRSIARPAPLGRRARRALRRARLRSRSRRQSARPARRRRAR